MKNAPKTGPNKISLMLIAFGLSSLLAVGALADEKKISGQDLAFNTPSSAPQESLLDNPLPIIPLSVTAQEESKRPDISATKLAIAIEAEQKTEHIGPRAHQHFLHHLPNGEIVDSNSANQTSLAFAVRVHFM